MGYRRLPREAIREGQRTREAGVSRGSNPYDWPIVLTSKNAPEFKAAARLRNAWFAGWHSAGAEVQAPVADRIITPMAP